MYIIVIPPEMTYHNKPLFHAKTPGEFSSLFSRFVDFFFAKNYIDCFANGMARFIYRFVRSRHIQMCFHLPPHKKSIVLGYCS